MYFGFDVFILDIELYMLGGDMVFMFLCFYVYCFYVFMVLFHIVVHWF